METSTKNPLSTGLPVRRDLAAVYWASLVISLVMATASIAGLVYRDVIYPTDELLRSGATNDAVNLFLGLPILLGSMWFARRGKLIGLLFWPGALFYTLYNYLSYVFAMPLTVLFPVYVLLVALSAYTTISLVASIDAGSVQQRLSGAVPERLCGGILFALGVLFLLLASSTIAGPLVNQTRVTEIELGVAVADVVMVPAFIIGGALLWQRRPLGYVGGTGLLFLLSMLFVGLIAILLLQPVLTDTPLPVTDIMVLLVMGSPCFIAFALFLRGIAAKGE
jgi:hypothetical protein